MIQHRISRAAASVANHRAAPRSKALRGQFTPGTGKLCRTRRLVSRRVRLARLISPSAVHTRSNARTRIWPPHCPTSALKPAPQLARGYMLHAAGHFRRQKLLRAAPTTSAGVVGLNQLQMQGADGTNDTTSHQSRGSKRCESPCCATLKSFARPIYPRNRQAMPH
jgi:hypothetical protein